jgi:hypothetical protein
MKLLKKFNGYISVIYIARYKSVCLCQKEYLPLSPEKTDKYLSIPLAKQVKSNLFVTMEGTNKVIKWYYEQKCPKFQIQLRKTLVVRCLFFFISCLYKIQRRLFIYNCEVCRNSFYTLNKEITIRIIP